MEDFALILLWPYTWKIATVYLNCVAKKVFHKYIYSLRKPSLQKEPSVPWEHALWVELGTWPDSRTPYMDNGPKNRHKKSHMYNRYSYSADCRLKEQCHEMNNVFEGLKIKSVLSIYARWFLNFFCIFNVSKCTFTVSICFFENSY